MENTTLNSDTIYTLLCDSATFTWELLGYVYNYIDETEFKY